MLYATNMQQMSVVMLVALTAGNIFFLFKRKIKPYLLLQNVIVAGMTAYSYYLNTVGENNRMVRETGRYFPEFRQQVQGPCAALSHWLLRKVRQAPPGSVQGTGLPDPLL